MTTNCEDCHELVERWPEDAQYAVICWRCQVERSKDVWTVEENKMQNTIDFIESRNRVKGHFKLEIFDVTKSGIVAPTPHEIQEFDNLFTNAGNALMLDLLIGAGGTTYANANAYIGVGDSSTAVSASHTDLQAASNKLRVAMQATYPSRSSQTLTAVSVFSTSQANWAWNEMAFFNASTAATMFCRALPANPFIKTPSLSITATYTISNA